MKEVLLKRWLLVLAWGILALISYTADAQTDLEPICIGGIPDTTTPEDFSERENGEIKHLPSNLIYMQCAIGQTYDNGECLGMASLHTWQEALQLSVGYEFNGSTNWRLPNLKELAMTVERACVRPAVNETSFPNTPADDFWTSTPSMQDPLRAWSVAFFNGTSSIKAKDRSIHVRLVRTALPNE